ncbi:peptidylprolyl isomerase [Shouchella sp. 1P09AA]|uniref:peptidylprolyl isomerase n=1 Tax=unclassified Shouchella TaxID=2893065 RepID=UPI0039A3B802
MKYFVVLVASLFIVTACGSSEEPNPADEAQAPEETNETSDEGVPDVPVEQDDTPVATIQMENGEEVIVELYPEHAPVTVNNFVALAEDHFYEGLTFHRIIEGFMIQGGDPAGNGSGGPGYGIKGEFESNDVDNPIKHERGVISMARAQGMDTAGSQFFIMHEDNAQLDGNYAAFGKVTSGMDVVDAIATMETNGETPAPGEEPIIQSITIER